MPLFRRYALGAPVYDVLSGERPVYRVGRLAGINALRLSPGDTVVDLGCGTGLNFPLLMERIGPGGLLVGVDRSHEMLRVAHRRVVRRGWDNVRLVGADASTLSPERLAATVAPELDGIPSRIAPELDGIPSRTAPELDGIPSRIAPELDGIRSRVAPVGSARTETRAEGFRVFDAAIATYAMSVFGDWHPAWDLMRSTLRPGGRIAIVDMARPVGAEAILGPIAALACATGAADIDAAPWTELERTGTDVVHSTFRAEHIHAVAGSFP